MKNGMSPFNGDFYASDGSIRNLDELIGSGSGGGSQGYNGWTPTPSIVVDNERRVLYITWQGGTGTKPQDGYVYEDGLTDDISLAVDIGGSQSIRFTHHQTEASNTWNIQHNIGKKFVDVLIVDESGDMTEGFVDYGSSTDNLLTVSFANAMKGTAFINY